MKNHPNFFSRRTTRYFFVGIPQFFNELRRIMTTLQFCFMFVCALAVSVLALGCSTAPLTLSKPIEVQGHRGARAVLPENTLPAMEYALSIGVDVLELDMGVTKDKVIVLSHDPHVNKVICQKMSGEGLKESPLIWSLTYAEIQKFDCGSLQNPRFPKQKPVPQTQMPRLRDLFTLVRDSKLPVAKKVRFNIETKIEADKPNETINPTDFVQLFLKEVKEFGLEDRVVLQSFDFRTLAEVRKQNPRIKTAALGESYNINEWLKIIKEYNVDIVSPYYKSLSAADIAEIHKNKVQVIPWTANEKSDWEKLVRQGVDGIISDDPEPLIAYLKSLPTAK